MNRDERNREADEPKIEIRTDSAPVTRRLPNFPNTEELYWTSRQLEEESIGSSPYELTVWAKMKKQTFFEFVEKIPTVQDTTFVPEFTPEQLENEYNWKKLDKDYVSEHHVFGESFEVSKLYVTELDVYIDTEHLVMYVRVVTAT
ncbi:hypothetical protein [uncultured Enterococcus sp.]|uniref:hypothetical protein n=1 Tax=uncultured Enterococcus sp. TaxID=167972 RepID=UPI002AA7AD2A|nr:hypothetical protein [uncultured Enterococcus sp.]